MDDWNASAHVPSVASFGTFDYARSVTAPVDKARPFMDDIGSSFIETTERSATAGSPALAAACVCESSQVRAGAPGDRRGERLAPELRDARLRARKEERAAVREMTAGARELHATR